MLTKVFRLFVFFKYNYRFCTTFRHFSNQNDTINYMKKFVQFGDDDLLVVLTDR